MDRNSLIGTVLIALITVFFLINTQKKRQQEALELQKVEDLRIADSLRAAERNEQIAPIVQEEEQDEVESPQLTDDAQISFDQLSPAQQDSLRRLLVSREEDEKIGVFGAFHKSATGEEEITTIETEVFKIDFNSKGGGISKVELKDFKTYDGKPLILVDPDRFKSSFRIPIEGSKSVITSDLYFESADKAFTISGETEKSISYRLKINEDQYFEKKFTFTGNSYLIDYQVNLVGLNKVIPKNTNQIYLSMSEDLMPYEKNLETERRYSNLYYRLKNSDVENLKGEKPNEMTFTERVEWISFKQQFFNTTLIYKDGFTSGKLALDVNTDDSVYVKSYEATDIRLPFNRTDKSSLNFQYFMGPNNYRNLKKLKIDLQDIIQFAPDFFLFKWMGVISKVLIIPIFSFFEKFISNYGIIILLMTLLIKMALFPLTFKSYKSAAAMRVLKPDLDALKEKFKDDQQKLGTEQMKLYSSAGVNPLGGCLPMVLQMPILLSMYYFFPSSIELRQEAFLWASDLSTYDNILNLPFTIPVYGDHVSLFTLLMTVSSILYATTQPQMAGGGPGGAQMKYMPYIFPVFLLFIFNKWPAALTYYYFLSNIITFGQAWAAKKFFIDEDKLYQKMQENKKKPKKTSKWAKRLEDIQKQQQLARKNQGRKTGKGKKK